MTRRARRALRFAAACCAYVCAPALGPIDARGEDPPQPVQPRPGLREVWHELESDDDRLTHGWFEDEFATGDWGGLRSRLAEHGVVPALAYAADIQGNAAGGLRKAVRYFQNIGFDLELDLEKLAGLAGSGFHLSVSSRSGRSLTEDAVGNVFEVAELCCGPTIRLVNVAFEQQLLNGKLDLAIGRLATGDVFLTSPIYCRFVNAAFCGNPASVFFNVPYTAYPTATWGARATVRPVPELYVMAGFYNGDPDLGRNGAHGLDWSWRSGVGNLLSGEVGLVLGQHGKASELPGNFKVGGFWHTGPFPDLGGSGRTERGNGGFYFLLDQMVYREAGEGAAQGLTPFVSLLFAPDDSLSKIPFFVNGGVVYRGLIPGRDADTLNLGVVYGQFSPVQRRAQRVQQAAGLPDITVQSFEMMIELGYILQLTQWLTVQPDVQYVVQPGGSDALRNAVVVGAQIAVSF